MPKFAQGRFEMKNPSKYVGTKTPMARSSWETVFMKMLDEHQGVAKWASESIQIPYRSPLTGKHTIYVPDFFIVYADKKGKQHAEVIEVKPDNQTTMESAGRNKQKQMAVALNMAKWQAARAWCKDKGLYFRVVTEKDMFHSGQRKG